jgi:DNA-binding NarL/FixJ family response regulator
LLGLRSTDKELLVAALKGATDRELADDLNLTKEAVKRRWKVLFDRLEAVKPEIFGASVSNNGKRGPQKRHRILAYVRDHPEELRPFKF